MGNVSGSKSLDLTVNNGTVSEEVRYHPAARDLAVLVRRTAGEDAFTASLQGAISAGEDDSEWVTLLEVKDLDDDAPTRVGEVTENIWSKYRFVLTSTGEATVTFVVAGL